MSIILSLVLASQVATKTPKPTRPLTVAEEAVIKTVVANRMNDPESANFRMYPLSLNADLYCGLVNAKNRFGGYVGYRLFSVFIEKNASGRVVDANTVSINGGPVTNGRTALVDALHDVKCRSEGYKLPDEY